MGDKPPSGYGDRLDGFELDGRTKDNLIRDQQRINALRAQQQIDKDEYNIEAEEMDVLEREMAMSS